MWGKGPDDERSGRVSNEKILPLRGTQQYNPNYLGDQAGDSKVCEEGASIPHDQDVGRLHVAVDYRLWEAGEVVECSCHIVK